MILRILFFSILLSRQALAHSCLQPFVPENGHVIFNEPGPYTPKTVAKYSCALGFERVGPEERVCKSDGTWSNEAPICAVDVAANKPTTQSTGTTSDVVFKGLCTNTENEKSSWWDVDLLGSYSVHAISIRLGKQSSVVSTIELTLNNGDIKLCDISTIDLSAGNSSATIISCKQKNVSRIRVTTRQQLHLCDFHVYATDAVSSWQCAQGSMDVVGIFDSMCFAASRDEQTDWLGAQRSCLDRGASLPLRISESAKRGLYSALSATPNQKAFYWIGVTSSTTQWRWADGAEVLLGSDWPGKTAPFPGQSEAILLARALGWKWVAAAQTAYNAFLCQSKPKFCTSPGVGEASRVVFSSHSYAIGTYCYYSCDEGYELRGKNQRECLESGRWSGEIPHCYRKECGDLDDWEKGEIILLNGSTTYESEIEYRCSTGYVLHGATRRQCQSDGSWSGVEPECWEVDCGKPSSIPNGNAHYIKTTYQSQVNFTCMEGFRLIGHDILHCSEKAAWEPNFPVCYDLITLRQMKGDGSDSNLVLAFVAVLLVAFLVVAVFRFSRPTVVQPSLDKMNPVIYATPTAVPNPVRGDSVIYYASCAAMTQMEIPPHMLSLQHLPNGNIHVTMPIVAGRPITRPQIPNFNAQSPTPSQLLYSFDHEPIYDFPPELGNETLRRIENVYERLPEVPLPPPPPPPKNPPPSD
ncbi:unnamed protein product [Auanema sp. JU1783]|nr:unnamed protein product [Auanema sp. JU1783]